MIGHWCSGRSLRGALVAAVLFAAAATVAAAADLVDQENVSGDFVADPGLNAFAPVGQEFVPSLQAVDFVEVFISNPYSSLTSAVGVELHVDTIGGTLLGSTGATEVPRSHHGPIRCSFTETVQLDPGARYVFLIQELAGVEVTLMATPDLYPQGRFIFWGEPYTEFDAWFREGVVATGTPAPTATWSTVKNLYR
jgi:hypothetical protein